MNENIMDGVHMARSRTIGKLNVTVIDVLRRLAASKGAAFLDPFSPSQGNPFARVREWDHFR